MISKLDYKFLNISKIIIMCFVFNHTLKYVIDVTYFKSYVTLCVLILSSFDCNYQFTV